MIKKVEFIIETYREDVERELTYNFPDLKRILNQLRGMSLLLTLIDDAEGARKLLDDYIDELQGLLDSQNKENKMNGDDYYELRK